MKKNLFFFLIYSYIAFIMVTFALEKQIIASTVSNENSNENIETITCPPNTIKKDTLIIGTDATFPPFSSKVGNHFTGYEIELGNLIGKQLKCHVDWVNASFDGIFPALLSNKFDMVISSVTITDERKQSMIFSTPYMNAGQAIAIRKDQKIISSIDDLKNLKVGVGLNTTGQYVLEPFKSITIVKFPSVDLALSDLNNKRLDAAVGDKPVFQYMINQGFPNLKLSGKIINQEEWGIVFSPEKTQLRNIINKVINIFEKNGTLKNLEAMHLDSKTSKEDASNISQNTSNKNGAVDVTADGTINEVDNAPTHNNTDSIKKANKISVFNTDRFFESIPILLSGAKWTLFLSIISFIAAIPLGLLIAILRLSKFKLISFLAICYIEILRGTPLLVQIFFLYFVLPVFGINLSETVTAIAALGINASAYISETFRSGILSIDKGQSEAGMALGFTNFQITRYILVPQAIQKVIPPLTNECIALIKDSSLVSVMGMTELTRTGQELASRYADPVTIWPGVALVYFLLTLPLTRLSIYLEKRLQNLDTNLDKARK